MKRITINPIMIRLPFDKFRAWHKRTIPDDYHTAEERYRELGGKVPLKKASKGEK